MYKMKTLFYSITCNTNHIIQKGNFYGKDLTTGNIFQRILIFAFPIFIGNVFQQLYNMADSIIVGRFVGKDAFAAVGSTGSLNFLIIGFVLGLSSGLCIPVAQRYGANKLSDMRRKIAAAVQISIVLGIGLTIVIACSTGALLRLMQTPDSIYKDAYTYIFIIFSGFLPRFFIMYLPIFLVHWATAKFHYTFCCFPHL